MEIRQTSEKLKEPTEKIVRDIRRATRQQDSELEKIRSKLPAETDIELWWHDKAWRFHTAKWAVAPFIQRHRLSNSSS